MTQWSLLVDIAFPAFICGASSVLAWRGWLTRSAGTTAAQPDSWAEWLAEREFDADLAVRNLESACAALKRGETRLALHELERASEYLDEVHEHLAAQLPEAA